MNNLSREKYLKFLETSKKLRELEAEKLELYRKLEIAMGLKAYDSGLISDLEAYEIGLISVENALKKGIITRSEARKKGVYVW